MSDSIKQAAALLKDAGWTVTEPSVPALEKYGCFCDLFAMDPGTKPDYCVIDEDCRSHCIYANAKHANGDWKIDRKETCDQWRAWTPESLAKYWKEMTQ